MLAPMEIGCEPWISRLSEMVALGCAVMGVRWWCEGVDGEGGARCWVWWEGGGLRCVVDVDVDCGGGWDGWCCRGSIFRLVVV